MHQEIRLHGHIDETIEYFATAAARDAYRGYFYEVDGERLRFFSPGNEFVLDGKGVSHRGNGGSFCEYMFGVDQPLADLAKGDVRNRLVLYGASYENSGNLRFTNHTEGGQSYERIFFEGNAVCNYFFFLTGSISGSLQDQQEGILRLLGKLLKRSPAVGAEDDAGLGEELFGLLGHKSSLYLVKLIDKRHKAYRDAFARLYLEDKAIPDEAFADLQQLAERLGIDKYQQERIRIDVMYKHPDNRRIVDEYKSILIDCNRRGSIGRLENARLTRLKTLSVRNKIPSALFYTLDEMLKHDNLVDLEEQNYIAETRQILFGLFFQERQIDASIDNEDMVKLLHAKRQASENRDHTFEHILLETGKSCDEKIRDGADLQLLENFSYIVTFFDRYDNAAATISQLAFMENIRLRRGDGAQPARQPQGLQRPRAGTLRQPLLLHHLRQQVPGPVRGQEDPLPAEGAGRDRGRPADRPGPAAAHRGSLPPGGDLQRPAEPRQGAHPQLLLPLQYPRRAGRPASGGDRGTAQQGASSGRDSRPACFATWWSTSRRRRSTCTTCCRVSSPKRIRPCARISSTTAASIASMSKNWSGNTSSSTASSWRISTRSAKG